MDSYAQQQAKQQNCIQEQFYVSVANGLCSLLTPILKTFSAQRPNVQPIILEKGSLDTVQSIRSVQSHLVLTQLLLGDYSSFQELAADYHLWHLCTEPLSLATSQTDPLTRKKAIPIQLLNDEVICFYTATLEDEPLSLKLLRQYHVQPKSIIPINSSLLMTNYIKNNLAYALVTPTRSGGFFAPLPDFTLIPIVPKIEMELVLFTYKKAFTASESAFCDMLKKTFLKSKQIF